MRLPELGEDIEHELCHYQIFIMTILLVSPSYDCTCHATSMVISLFRDQSHAVSYPAPMPGCRAAFIKYVQSKRQSDAHANNV
jgi:hypothetical protein